MQNLKENWHEAWRNLVNFHAGSQMSENLYFDGLLQSKAFKVLGEKANKSYVSWHWRVMQSLKKNWLLVPKMTWRTWWTLMWAVASLKICTLMCYLSIAYKVSAKKVHQSYLMALKSDPNFEEKLTFCLKNDVRNLVNFNASSGKSENLHFHGLCLLKACNVWNKKMQGGCVVKNDLKNDIKGIWWILIQVVEINVKILCI